jgi:OmpA-OmpF porin, OOP family
MKPILLRYTLYASGMILLAGCAMNRAQMTPMQFTPKAVASGQYVSKVDNAVIIEDASMSMGDYDQAELQQSKNLLGSMNRSLPADLNVNMGLRSFGHDDKQSKKLTEQIYGMTRYSRDGLQKGIDSIRYAGGNSPLDKALLAAGEDLKGASGTSAIIVVSDGLQMNKAPAAARTVKGMLGDNVCIYTVQIGDTAAGSALLEQVAKAGGCGSTDSAASLASAAGMGAFVEKVFLAKAPMAAAAPMVPMDSDGDGVTDDRDQCPNTPMGELVDADGCTLKLTLHINFDFDKADIKPEFKPDLDQAAAFIRKNANVPYILIAGHTDHIGTVEYNQELSEKRAQNVRQYLIDNYGINPDRLGAKGYGKSQPVASNQTDAGRYQNRRVEIICCVLKPL